MIISYSKKIIFIHISKNAGMYVTRLLTEKLSKNDIVISGPKCTVIGNPVKQSLYNVLKKLNFNNKKINRNKNVYNLLKHSSALELKKVLKNNFDKYLKFVIIRNPFDRAVSSFFYLKKVSLEKNKRENIKNKKLREVLERIKCIDSFEEFVSGNILDELINEKFFMPQWNYISDENGKIIVDKILRFEDLDNELKQINFIKNISNKKINESKRERDYSKYYTNDSIEKISRLYKIDIENFSYKFGE